MMRGARNEFETITSGFDLDPAALTEALEAWARADGSRVTAAVVFLLTKAGLAESWPMFGEHLSIQLYTDPEDPEAPSYPVARVLEWSTLHNAIPTDAVGKSALALFVYARCLGDRGFSVFLSDLLEGMEPRTMRVVHEANAIRFGLPRDPAWGRKKGS